MDTLILIKCSIFYPYLMVMHVRAEGDKSVFSSAKFETLLTLFESKPHIIIIFHLKTNRQKLKKHHVNGSQTRIANAIMYSFYLYLGYIGCVILLWHSMGLPYNYFAILDRI